MKKDVFGIGTLTAEPPVIKEPLITVHTPAINHRSNSYMDVMRIVLDDEYTRIDFVHYAAMQYLNGGWVQIQGDTFIRILGSTDRLTLIKAINIPIAPTKHWYSSKQEYLYFTLLFPSIPKSTTHIDIIEREGGDRTFFNFYGVSMNKVNNSVIRILN